MLQVLQHVPRLAIRGIAKRVAELADTVFEGAKFDAVRTGVGIVTTKWVIERPMIFKASIDQAHGGVYAWFFKDVPPRVPTGDCVECNGLKLLYVGISPHKAFRPTTRQNLRRRIRYHFGGNAYGSTLRLTLGVLLAEQSGLPPRRVGSGERIALTHAGEQWLDRWMDQNAFVAWLPHQEPWLVEHHLISRIPCPLNIADNAHHPFNAVLRVKRKAALARARALPIASEGAATRRST